MALEVETLVENNDIASLNYWELKKIQERMRKILACGGIDTARRIYGSEF